MKLYSLACLSDTGSVRNHNEDNFVFFGEVMPVEHQSSPVHAVELPGGNSFAVGVFDGMGGEAAGEFASHAAAIVLGGHSQQQEWSAETLFEVFAAMEAAVCEERDRLRVSSMGTTATVLAVSKQRAYIANVGDSPAMLYSEGKLQTVSRAHTDVEMMRALGITGRKPGLTQFLGMSDGEITPEPHICDFALLPGSSVLLASDGLIESLGEAEIAEVLASDEETQEKAARLRDLAIKNGATDNVTVLLCEVIATGTAAKDVV